MHLPFRPVFRLVMVTEQIVSLFLPGDCLHAASDADADADAAATATATYLCVRPLITN